MIKQFLLLFLIIAFAFHPAIAQKLWSSVITLELQEKDSMQERVSRTIDFLNKRLSFFPDKDYSVKYDSSSRQFEIKLPAYSDTSFYSKLINSSGHFEIRETYDMEVLFPALMKIDSLILDVYNHRKVLSDQNITLADSHLFSILMPNLNYDGKAAKGAMIGLSKREDTAKVNWIFRQPEVMALLPPNVEFKWGRGIISSPRRLRPQHFDLFAIKKRSPARITITGKMIEEAIVQKTSYDPEYYEVRVILKKEFHEVWESLSRLNINSCLAMIIDDKVLAAPNVREAITVGSFTIPSGWDTEEARLLAAFLRAESTYGLKILSVESAK